MSKTRIQGGASSSEYPGTTSPGDPRAFAAAPNLSSMSTPAMSEPLQRQTKSLRDFMVTNQVAVPPALHPPTGNVIVIARNPSVSESAGTAVDIKWEVKQLSIGSREGEQLMRELNLNPNKCRANDFEQYAIQLFGLLASADHARPRSDNLRGQPIEECVIHPNGTYVLDFALRNCLGKMEQRLESCNRPFMEGAGFWKVLLDWSVRTISSTIPSTTEQRRVRLTDSLGRLIRWLRSRDIKLDNKSIEWSTLEHIQPTRTADSMAHFGPGNAHVWTALLSYLLMTISTNVQLMKKHDLGSNEEDRLGDDAFACASRTLSAHLEALTSFFHRREPQEGWMSPSDVLAKLLGDTKLGLIGFLESKAFPGFKGDGPRMGQESNSTTRRMTEDTSALEEEESLFTDADEEDVNMGPLGTMIATTLNNVCGFAFAAREASKYYDTRDSNHIFDTFYFLISGENTPKFTLTEGEVDQIKTWAKESLSIQPNAWHGLRKLHSFLNNAPLGVNCAYHCESLLMGVIRHATSGERTCEGRCNHDDRRCILYQTVKAQSTLWNGLLTGPAIAVSVKKACAHCMFTAVHARHQLVFNTDGTHGLGFKTRFFGLSDDVMQQFADLLLETIKKKDTGSQTQQSSPNRSLHGGGTPPKASLNAQRVFEVDDESEDEDVYIP
ncbi:hypothetical protein CALCODRAFT_513578 [Calocera cornea HHB12733]|uniref:Uncharacterized protein n=1 Tax=Calocera cornea HHB12733 TaxID=1353952 RepID=A0A165AMQ8_9BASI|nr:hypothetical protein CALCODRAFT_513578 [Calocera cornea HHB12733]